MAKENRDVESVALNTEQELDQNQAPAGEVEVKSEGKGKRKAVFEASTSSKKKSSGEPESLSILGSEERMSVDSFVRLRCGQSTAVVRITKIDVDCSGKEKHKVHVQWCYRPEETKAGRQPFHGESELLISDRETVEDWTSVLGTCNVLTVEESMRRRDGSAYFWRFHYQTETGNCYRIGFYCLKCDDRHNAGPLTLQQQLTGEAPFFACPMD